MSFCDLTNCTPSEITDAIACEFEDAIDQHEEDAAYALAASEVGLRGIFGLGVEVENYGDHYRVTFVDPDTERPMFQRVVSIDTARGAVGEYLTRW